MSEKLLEFYRFIYERQSIYHKRHVLGLQRPWTEDKILAEFKFCEAYRELDRCSKYIIERVVDNGSLSNSQKAFAILMFRIFNIEGLFDKVFNGVPAVELFEAKVRIAEADKYLETGGKIFNSAYNITQRTYCSEYRKGEKHVQHLLNLETIAKLSNWCDFFSKIHHSKSAKDVFEAIKDLNFFGPFLAYQCMVDISYIKGFLNHDWNSFTYVGPGARPTIDYIFGEQRNDLAYAEKCRALYEYQELGFNHLALAESKYWRDINYNTPYNNSPYLSLNNIQSACCEFRKYCGYKSGSGVKRKYFTPKEK